MVRDPLLSVNWPTSISHNTLCPPWSLSIHRGTPTRSPNTSLLNTHQLTEGWEVSWPKISWVLGLSQACQSWLVKLAQLCTLQHCLHYSTGQARRTTEFLETSERQLEPSQTTGAKDVCHPETACTQTGDYLFSCNFHEEFHVEEDRGITKLESQSLKWSACVQRSFTPKKITIIKREEVNRERSTKTTMKT